MNDWVNWIIESLNHWIIESLNDWVNWIIEWLSELNDWMIEWIEWLNDWVNWIIESLNHWTDWFVLISFTSPVLNGIIGRLLGYRYMWLYSGLLYMLCILITPICALTIGKPEWVESSLFPWTIDAMARHLCHLCMCRCSSNRSVYCHHRHHHQRFLPRFSRQGQRHRPSLCLYRKIPRWNRREGWKVGTCDRDERVFVEFGPPLFLAIRLWVCFLCRMSGATTRR